MNNITKHTPGPWAINSDEKDKIIVYAEHSHKRIALCSNYEKSDNALRKPKSIYAKESLSNAELIARAPELLEENESLKSKCQNLTEERDYFFKEVGRLKKELEEEIATGRQEWERFQLHKVIKLEEANKELIEALEMELWAEDNGEYASQELGKPGLNERLEIMRTLIKKYKS